MSNSLSISPNRFDKERVELLKRNYAQDTNDLEFELFLSHCKKFNLSPEAGHIYCVPRFTAGKGRTFVTQISLQGLRVAAERTGEYRGQIGPLFFCEQTKVWLDYWLDDKPPKAAKVGILRKGFSEPVFFVAKFDSYAQKNKQGNLVAMWEKMPEHMIGKCAAAGAIKIAFPDLLDSTVITEENSNNVISISPQTEKIEPEVSEDRIMNMIAKFDDIGVSEKTLMEHIGGKLLNDMTLEDLKNLGKFYHHLLKLEEQSEIEAAINNNEIEEVEIGDGPKGFDDDDDDDDDDGKEIPI